MPHSFVALEIVNFKIVGQGSARREIKNVAGLISWNFAMSHNSPTGYPSSSSFTLASRYLSVAIAICLLNKANYLYTFVWGIN